MEDNLFQQFFQMAWEIDEKSKKHVREIAHALKGAEKLYLATDPDREGEAISWHVRELLDKEQKLEGVDVNLSARSASVISGNAALTLGYTSDGFASPPKAMRAFNSGSSMSLCFGRGIRFNLTVLFGQ